MTMQIQRDGSAAYLAHVKATRDKFFPKNDDSAAITTLRQQIAVLDETAASQAATIKRQQVLIDRLTREVLDQGTEINALRRELGIARKRRADGSFGVGAIQTAVSNVFDVPILMLRGRSREYPIMLARFAVYFVGRRQGHSYAELGRRTGDRDHTTALHGARRAGALMELNEDFAERIRLVEAYLVTGDEK